ncbi:MAG TPA: DUF2200 family protein, partial [Anaerolineae bacterium]|nr:DUF2200 family protein [Anaerolineae bacterium]
QIICWLTGYSQADLQQQIEQENDFETFFAQAPALHFKGEFMRRLIMVSWPKNITATHWLTPRLSRRPTSKQPGITVLV